MINAVHYHNNNAHHQDAFGYDLSTRCFAVADGVSALPDSGYASAAAVLAFLDYVECYDANLYDFNAADALNYVAKEVVSLSNDNLRAATTFTGVVVDKDGTVRIAHIGDSKAVVIDDGQQVFETTNHEIEDNNGIIRLSGYITSRAGIELFGHQIENIVIPSNKVNSRHIALMTDGVTTSYKYKYELSRLFDGTYDLSNIDKAVMKFVGKVGIYDDKTMILAAID